IKLAAAYGVSTDDVLTVAGTSTGDSWVARTWGFFDDVARAYDSAGVPVRYRPWSKDLWDVVAAARAADIHLPVAGLLAQTMVDMVESSKAASSGASAKSPQTTESATPAGSTDSAQSPSAQPEGE